MSSGFTSQNLISEEDAKVIGHKSLGSLNEWSKFLRGRITEVPWTVGSSISIEGLRLSILQHS
jgi:hypothetical protein